MPRRLYKLLPCIGICDPRGPPRQYRDALFLHGGGHFSLVASGNAQSLAAIREIVLARDEEANSYRCVVDLIVENRRPGKGAEVQVIAFGKPIAYLPAHIVTQYIEWLRRWNYTEAQVSCEAAISRMSDDAVAEARFVVRLDLDVPFRMTTPPSL